MNKKHILINAQDQYLDPHPRFELAPTYRECNKTNWTVMFSGISRSKVKLMNWFTHRRI